MGFSILLFLLENLVSVVVYCMANLFLLFQIFRVVESHYMRSYCCGVSPAHLKIWCFC